jgi:hypothetical protein
MKIERHAFDDGAIIKKMFTTSNLFKNIYSNLIIFERVPTK